MSESKLCFEDLSNDIVMEVFDYLYGPHIVFAFSQLNSRFNLLCIHYSNYHIDASDYRSFRNRKQFNRLLYLIYSKHIRSLTFCLEKWIRRIKVKYLLSLRSLTFIIIRNPIIVKEFIEKLPLPHRLHRLSLNGGGGQFSDMQDLLTTILKLPNLNRLECNSNRMGLDFSTINQPLLSLRYLSISCSHRDVFLKFTSFIPNLV